MSPSKSASVDEYISVFPQHVQVIMQQIRKTILQAAPGAQEVISYAMPGYKLNGSLVWFGGYKHHIGFYPSSSGISEFKDEFSEYKWSKGAVQFPLDQPIPFDLIEKIVKFRVKENLGKLHEI
jgi:uncharacterized protein YdhG (YjbR/CyaY superfamily)